MQLRVVLTIINKFKIATGMGESNRILTARASHPGIGSCTQKEPNRTVDSSKSGNNFPKLSTVVL